MYRLSHLSSLFFSIFGCRRIFGRRKFFVLQRSWVVARRDPQCNRMDAVAPYIQQSTRIGSVDVIWWVLAPFLVLFWGTAVTIRRRSFFHFKLSHSHPLLPLCFVSNFAEYSCLIVERCVQCYFAFWLTFYWSFFNLQWYFLQEKMGRYKKIVFVKNCATIWCRSTLSIDPTINP